MKIKVKGLVFVGFAAAILSANAMATNDSPSGTTITSLAYTDATYQKLNNMTKQGDSTTNVLGTGTGTDDKYPSEKAVATAIGAISESLTGVEVTSNKLNGTSTQGQKIGDLAAGNAAGQDQVMYPSAAAVKEYAQKIQIGAAADSGKLLVVDSAGKISMSAETGANTYQTKAGSGDANKVADGAGGWKALNSDISDTAVAGNGYDTGNGATTAAIRSYTQSKSDATSGTYKVGHTGTSWVTLGTDGYVTIDNTNVNTPKIKLDSTKINNSGSVASNATNTATDLVTEYTLSNTINGINNTINSLPSSSIPGQSSLCTASVPCALVAEGTNYHWRVMAVSANQTTAAGTLADYCTSNTDCTAGTCNTTGGANVCVEQ